MSIASILDQAYTCAYTYVHTKLCTYQVCTYVHTLICNPIRMFEYSTHIFNLQNLHLICTCNQVWENQSYLHNN